MPPDLPPDDEPIPDTVRMITYEDAARVSLRANILELGLDEVLVLDRLAERLRRGQRQYGFLHLANDRRAFRAKEAREELEDALVYLACAWLKAETREVA
jgi:aryl carrier-like protein